MDLNNFFNSYLKKSFMAEKGRSGRDGKGTREEEKGIMRKREKESKEGRMESG